MGNVGLPHDKPLVRMRGANGAEDMTKVVHTVKPYRSLRLRYHGVLGVRFGALINNQAKPIRVGLWNDAYRHAIHAWKKIAAKGRGELTDLDFVKTLVSNELTVSLFFDRPE